MKLSDETYGVIADNYGEETAQYARQVVEDYESTFPNLEGLDSDVGLGVVMDSYLEIHGSEGLEAALQEFAEDLEETRQRGILRILSAEANNQEL